MGPQGVSVTPDAVGMRSETTTLGRVWREMPRVPCPSRRPSVRPARSHSLPVERLLPGPLRHPSPPGVSLFLCFRCHLDRPPASHSPPRHPPLPGVSLFRCFRCYLGRPPAPHGPLRHPSLPGMSLFRRIGSHLRRVTMYPALWQRAPAPDAPLKNGESALRKLGDSELLITVLVRRPSVEHSPSRGTSRCAPGAFSLTAPVFRSSRAQKGVWCARADLAKPIRYRRRPCGVRKAHNVSRNCTGWRGGEAACGNRWR